MQRHQIVTGVSIAIGTFITYQIYSKSNREQYELPGPIPSDKVMGNFSDMNEAGSLPEYLLELTKKYGNIGAFWWGDTRVAYITSQKVLFDTENKKFFNKLRDRPQLLFDAFKPLISEYSIQYANGHEFVSKYHKVFLMAFGKNMTTKVPIIIDQTQQIIKKWNDKKTINISDDSFEFASKSIFHICFGSKVVDKNTISEFIAAYKMAWGEMEKRLIDGIPSDDRLFYQSRTNSDGKIKQQIMRTQSFNGSFFNVFGTSVVRNECVQTWQLNILGNTPSIIGVIEKNAKMPFKDLFFGCFDGIKSYSFNTLTFGTHQSGKINQGLSNVFKFFNCGKYEKPLIMELKLDMINGTLSITNVTLDDVYYGLEVVLFNDIDTTKEYKLAMSLVDEEIINLL